MTQRVSFMSWLAWVFVVFVKIDWIDADVYPELTTWSSMADDALWSKFSRIFFSQEGIITGHDANFEKWSSKLFLSTHLEISIHIFFSCIIQGQWNVLTFRNNFICCESSEILKNKRSLFGHCDWLVWCRSRFYWAICAVCLICTITTGSRAPLYASADSSVTLWSRQDSY